MDCTPALYRSCMCPMSTYPNKRPRMPRTDVQMVHVTVNWLTSFEVKGQDITAYQISISASSSDQQNLASSV